MLTPLKAILNNYIPGFSVTPKTKRFAFGFQNPSNAAAGFVSVSLNCGNAELPESFYSLACMNDGQKFLRDLEQVKCSKIFIIEHFNRNRILIMYKCC